MEGSRTLTLKIITPEGTVYDGPAEHAVFPGEAGQFAVYPMHAPLVAALDKGDIRYYPPSGEARYAIEGGFAEVLNDVVTASVEPAGGHAPDAAAKRQDGAR